MTTDAEPLSRQEEADYRYHFVEGSGAHVDGEDIRRLLATLDVARATPPEPAAGLDGHAMTTTTQPLSAEELAAIRADALDPRCTGLSRGMVRRLLATLDATTEYQTSVPLSVEEEALLDELDTAERVLAAVRAALGIPR